MGAHKKLHDITDVSNHNFPGGNNVFLNGDGNFLNPTGSAGLTFLNVQLAALVPYVLAHNSNNQYINIAVYDSSTKKEVEIQKRLIDANLLELIANTNISVDIVVN